MHAVWASSTIDAESVPPQLAEIARAGVVLVGDRVLLARPETGTPPPPDSDDWAAERWTNKIHLDSPRAATDPAWRRELVSWGLAVAEPLVEQAASLTDLPVQATVTLQSAPGEADPDADCATGAIHLYCIRNPGDDATGRIDDFAQPLLTLTTNR